MHAVIGTRNTGPIKENSGCSTTTILMQYLLTGKVPLLLDEPEAADA